MLNDKGVVASHVVCFHVHKYEGFLNVGRAKDNFLKVRSLGAARKADLEKILPDSIKACGPESHKIRTWKQAN